MGALLVDMAAQIDLIGAVIRLITYRSIRSKRYGCKGKLAKQITTFLSLDARM